MLQLKSSNDLLDPKNENFLFRYFMNTEQLVNKIFKKWVNHALWGYRGDKQKYTVFYVFKTPFRGLTKVNRNFGIFSRQWIYWLSSYFLICIFSQHARLRRVRISILVASGPNTGSPASHLRTLEKVRIGFGLCWIFNVWFVWKVSNSQ